MSRLSHALDAGAVTLPEFGSIAVIDPPVGYDLSALPRDRVEIVTPNKPAYDAFEAAGYPVDVIFPKSPALAIIVAGRSKERNRGNLALAALSAAPVIVDGDKTAGVDSLYRDLKGRASVSPAYAKAHGKVFALAPVAGLLDWLPGPGSVDGLRTWPGVFSADRIDPGSKLLADTLPPLKGRVADLGSGWGYLAHRALAASPGITEMHLVEADAHAASCGRDNVPDPRAQHHWADALTWTPEAPLDAVVMNPPFHTGRAADPALGQSFIRAAAGMLGRNGALWLVANRHLPYEGVLEDCFREVETVKADPAFKIFHARKPRPR